MYSSRRGAPGGAKSATACIRHCALWAKIILADFKFGGFNPDRQTAKFNFPSNFPAIRYIAPTAFGAVGNANPMR